MNERADSASPSCEAAYRKRRRSYSAAMSDENSLDDEPEEDEEDEDEEKEEEEEEEVEESYPHRDDATRTGCCRQRECVARKVSSLESETWSIESLVSKRELTKGSSGDSAKSWSEIEIPELLLAHPEILSRMMRCRCFIPQFSAACRCAQCQYRRRKISWTSSCLARDSLLSAGARRKDSGYSASTCQSFLPSSSCGGNSAGSLYHGYPDIGDNAGAIQRRHSIAAAAPIQHSRYSDQTHSPCGCQIGREDNRRRLSAQPLAGDAIGNREGAGAASAAEPIIARTYPRGYPEATACATRSAASFHQDSNTTTAVSAPVDAKAPRGGETTSPRPAKGGKNVEANARRRSSVLTITPKMMRRRFSEQLILEGGLGSVGEFENLADQAEDANEGEESLTAINARKKITLKRHYYPEGGWGYVIVVITILVQLISHGLQLAYGSLMNPTMTRFEQTVGNSDAEGCGSGCCGGGFIGGAHWTSGNFDAKRWAAETAKIKDRDVQFNYLDAPRDGRTGSRSNTKNNGMTPMQESATNLCSSFSNNNLRGFPRAAFNCWVTEKEKEFLRYAARCTIRQHYYPENGWGWVIVVTGVMVQILATGIHGAVGAWLLLDGAKRYRQTLLNVGWLGAMSTGVALLVSPVTIAFCRRKSTRVTAVLGGLVTALGCLFTSFASQFHQLFFSYGTVVGIGVGMTRDCSTLMVAQYFKRKRELVEIFIVSGSGLGIAVMSAFIKGAISKIGWRLGLQAVTGVVFLTFILGTFYRSASLYHPQRRAILHLKNQKRKIKDKNKTDDRPPFFDFSTLKSKTVRILLVSTGISAFGINTPIFYLAHQAEEEGLGDTVVLLQAYLGLAWTLGCVAFGLLVVHRSVECRIARQYLTQAAVFVCGLCILALTAVQGNYHGYVMFAWIYGIFCGGYHYSLKMYTYERVRARNFARTWGFVQCSQAIPIAIGVPISGYINVGCGGKAGYYFSSTCVLVGSFTLFFIDLHRRNLSKHKHTRANGTKHLCASDSCPQRRRASFSQEPENEGPHVAAAGAAGATAAALVLGADIAPAQGEAIDVLGTDKPELTCISEEGIADMDLPDNLFEDLEYVGDCITSCNKVENYLMLSEFENNLIAEMPMIMDRRGRRWSLARSKTGQPLANCAQTSSAQSTSDEEEIKSKWRLTNAAPSNTNSRMITVIDEASA